MDRRTVLALFLISLLIRGAVLLIVGDIPLQADENEYYRRAVAFQRMATNRLAGEASDAHLRMTAYGAGVYPPLHSALLAVPLFVWEDTSLARVAVVVISALTTPVVYLLTLCLSTRRAALIAAGAHIFYPSFIAFSHYLWSETTYIFFLLLGTYSLIRLLEARETRRRVGLAVAVGSVFGLTALTRAAALPFLVLVPLWTLVSLRKVGGGKMATAVVLASGSLLLLPWELTLHRREGRFVALSTAAAYNLYLGNNPWESYDRFQPDAKERLTAAIEAHARASSIGREEAIRGLVLQELQRAPGQFFVRAFQKLRALWAVDRTVGRHILHAAYPPMSPWLVVSIGLALVSSFLGFVALALWGLFATGPAPRHRALMTSMIVAGMLPSLVTVADTRFALPLLALLLPVVGHGAVYLRRPSKNAYVVGAVLLTIALLWANAIAFSRGRRVSVKTSSYYYSLIGRVDRLLGSETPFTDRISLRVIDPPAGSGLRVVLLSPGYRFHDTGNKVERWEFSPETSTITLRIYAHRPTEPLRMRLARTPAGRRVELEPVTRGSWRRWRPTGLHGIDYRWRGGGPPPPNP